jgi:glycosyltransferase involved in cell wall biosynthesis
MKITFCIPVKNNLRYLKGCIKSIKENSFQTHDVIVYLDTDMDGTENWLISNNIRYIKNNTETPKGIAHGYNECIRNSKTDIVCMFHADMYMAKGFDSNLLKHLKEGVVVSATRIEPPLHPTGLEKIVENFGMYPEDFLVDDFNEFVVNKMNEYDNQTTNGIFAPWVVFKSDIEKIGLHDEVFHSYHEDSDIFNRMLLTGMKLIQSRDSFVYHFTCRGGQFQDGIESITTDSSFHKMKNNAARHYIRKWGSWIKNDEYHHPILIPKYDIGIVLGSNYKLIEYLEPWASSLYVNNVLHELVQSYMATEQPNTPINLSEKISNYTNDIKNDITIYIDDNFNQFDFNNLQLISQIIWDTNELGTFQLGNLKITINSLDSYELDLIKIP